LLEAMASECAIVATDVGETRDLVNQELGYLVKKNAGEIADRVQFLIENPQVTTSMGRKAREFMFRKHTIENYMLYLDKIYCG
jgi:glycosyltransferase involved in cell wall biosynthesis